MTVTPSSGPASCNQNGSGGHLTCSSSDPQGFTAANAVAMAHAGFVSVELQGGARWPGTSAAASSRASNSENYLFTNGIGTGILNYSVALMGFANGNPAVSSAVLFNGASYSVLPNAAPTYYSFSQNFTYGQAFVLTLTVEMNSNWIGSLGDGGSRFASARLISVDVVNPIPPAAAADVPEPSTAIMWMSGALLVAVGLRRNFMER
jgi:hypothetical protein